MRNDPNPESDCDDDDDVELVPIPLDRETRERLVEFSRCTGKHPACVGADLLRDLLRDDADAHRLLN